MCMVEELCRISVRVVKGESIVKLLEALVGSVLVYGAEVWGCCRQMGPLKQVQMRAAGIFLGLGRRHPRVALQYEMMMLPLIWEARRRCIVFWLKVIGMNDRRLIRLVAPEAQEPQNMVKWWEDLKHDLEKVEWRSEVAEKLKGVESGSEVSQVN